MHNVTPVIILAMVLGLTACGGQATRSTLATTPAPSDTPLPTFPPTLTSSPSPTVKPTAASTSTPTPQPAPRPIEGYWIQNTTEEGLCSDSPRFIGFDDHYNRPYIGGSGATMCYFDHFGLERWTRDLPSPIFGFPSWISVDIPGLGRVTGGTAFSPYASANPHVPSYPGVYGMPSFVGSGGQCILDAEGEWQCFTTADGLPFDDVRGYGIVQDTNVEWFMSAESVASRGLLPEDLFYAIPELVGEGEARPTCLGVPRSTEEGIWVATEGHGVIHIEQAEGHATRYTVAEGLPGDVVRDVQPCGERCAWVATADGVGHWNGARWKAYTTRDGLPSDDVRGISAAAYYWRGGTWAATAEGPAFLAEGAERWQDFPDFPEGIEVNGVMYGDFSTRGQGLIRFVQASIAQGHTTFTVEDGLPSDQIKALAATMRGVLVGTPRGAVEWDGHTWAPITEAAVNDASGTAIATQEGLWAWNGGTWQRVNEERITLVAEGGWYATPGQVCRWENGVSTCPTTSDGGAIAGAQVLDVALEEGLVRVVSVTDGQGQSWLCNAPNCDSEGFVTPAWYFPERMLPRRINDQIITRDTHLYATQHGIYDADGIGDYRLAGGWPVSVRRMSLNEATGTLWIATNQGAFYRLETDTHGRSWTYVAGLPSRDVTAVLPTSDSSAWLGTADAGLVYFEPYDS